MQFAFYWSDFWTILVDAICSFSCDFFNKFSCFVCRDVTICHCHPDGTIPGVECDDETGKCSCRKEAQGNIKPDNIHCVSLVSMYCIQKKRKKQFAIEKYYIT